MEKRPVRREERQSKREDKTVKWTNGEKSKREEKTDRKTDCRTFGSANLEMH